MNKIFACGGAKLKLPLNIERLRKLRENLVGINEKIKESISLPLPISKKKELILAANFLKEISFLKIINDHNEGCPYHRR